VPFLIDQLDSDHLLIFADTARVPGKRNAIEPVPHLLERLKNGDLYGPRSRLYRAITQAFQIFRGIRAEIDSTSRGRCPALLEISGFAQDLPEAMTSLRQSHFRQLNQMLSNLETRVGDLSARAAFPEELVSKVVENPTWKFGVLFADARDAGEDEVQPLVELLGSEADLARAAAALRIPWYVYEEALEPLAKAAEDPEETVRTAAKWARNALPAALAYRKGTGTSLVPPVYE